MKKRLFAILFTMSLIFSSVAAFDPAEAASAWLSVSNSSARPLETVSVSFSGGSGIGGSWIGMYKSGSADNAYLTYQYINTQTSGTLQFSMPNAPGTYEFRIFSDSGYNRIGSSSQISVVEFSPTVTLSSYSVNPNGAISVYYSNASGIGGSWIGMYKSGSADNAYLTYQYINTNKSGTLNFTAPNAPGTYEFRIFKDSGYVKLGSSSQFTVGSSSPVTPTVPDYKTTLKASSAANGILLKWNASTDSSVVGYNLYRGTSSGKQSSTPVTDFYIKGISYTDSNADPNVRSYYILRPVYKDGSEGPSSNEAYAVAGGSSYSGTTIVLKINDPNMIVNGVSQEIDPGRGTAPIIVNGRTVVPIRAIIEAMGGTIGWNDYERKITIQTSSKSIELWVDKKNARVNGISTTTDVPPQIINGRTMVPVRFVTENLDCEVQWDGEQNRITINVKN